MSWGLDELQKLGDFLAGIGTIAGAILVLVVALIGGNTFRSWKRQQVLQRHMGVAESLLVLAYRFRQVIRDARAEVNVGFHKQDEKFVRFENASRSELSSTVLERLLAHQSTFDELEALKPLTFAYFGPQGPTLIDRLLTVVTYIKSSAMLHDILDEDEEWEHYAPVISALHAQAKQEDHVARRVDLAVAEIEKQMAPLLRQATGGLTLDRINAVISAPLYARVLRLLFGI